MLENELCISDYFFTVQGCIQQSQINHSGMRHSDCFVYVLCGSMKYTFKDGKVITVNADDILYLPKSSIYVMDNRSEKYEFVYCDFDFASEGERLPFSEKSSDSIRNEFARENGFPPSRLLPQ